MPGVVSSLKTGIKDETLISWSYGVGEEGLKHNKVGQDNVFIIDDKFPCWFTAAKAVGLNILGIWLTSTDAFPLFYLETFTKGVAVHQGPLLPKLVSQTIKGCSVCLVGGHIPEVLVRNGMFEGNLRCVISTKKNRFAFPNWWQEVHHRISHSLMGGVTNGEHIISVYIRDGGSDTLVLNRCALQDLRSVLKTGEPGKPNCNMTLPSTNEAVGKVRFCGPGIIDCSSLWPVEWPNIKVRTKWRGLYWIERKLSLFEKLLAFDVPEKLIRMIPEGIEREELCGMIHAPSKVLHGFLIAFYNVTNRKPATGKRVRDVTGEAKGKNQNKKAKRDSKQDDTYAVVPIKKRSSALVNKLQTIFETDQEDGVDEAINTNREEKLEELVEGAHNIKATKNDDAEVRTNLWDKHLLLGFPWVVQNRDTSSALDVLRNWFLGIWKRRLTRSFFVWMQDRGCRDDTDVLSLFEDARDCLTRSANATWWLWDAGSRPFFWRWPIDYADVARSGAPIWLDGQIKPWIQKQRGTPDPVRKRHIKTKLDTIRGKGYVEVGKIISLMAFFDVPKGDDDIRMVYDGSASGLNDHLWAPWFSLPTVDHLLRSLEPGYCMADNDVGEMFHNFMLNKQLREYCGLDMSNYSSFEQNSIGKRVWLRWNRLAMGLRSSPFSAVQGMMIAREVILGDRLEESNVFRWDRVRTNLPGTDSYTPSLAWCTKVRKNGDVAADVFIYVDDIRCSAPTQEEAWRGSQRTSSVLGYLGLQDAARKRRDPGQETGAWTGSVVWTSNNKLSVMTTQEKWDKLKAQLNWIRENIDNTNGLDNKRLQSIRGFLVYVSRTYGSLVPYLKGLHATIDSWRYGRTSTGWKMGAKKFKQQSEVVEDNEFEWEERLGLTQMSHFEPTHVLPVPRFRKDLSCLIELTRSSNPPLRMGRMNTHARVMYGFGDASRHGFGASIELSDKSIFWRFGQWRLEEEFQALAPANGVSIMEERSSNYRELRNLVEVLESAFKEGMLQDREIFMFTDNSTAEAAFFKGTSSSELLFELVLRLRKLEMTGKCIIHMVHVAGTRMIHQGTDGLSRGDKTSGVMSGESMLSFVPLHLTAFERSGILEAWITGLLREGWCDDKELIVLAPDDWPKRLYDHKIYLWVPPPAIAEIAGDYLAQSLHKRTNSTHIFICPRLMTCRWFRIVRKATDMIFAIPIGSSLWGMEQHEPLMMCISLPLSRNRPWKHGGTPYCEHLGKILPSLLCTDPPRAGIELRQCFLRAWGMAPV